MGYDFVKMGVRSLTALTMGVAFFCNSEAPNLASDIHFVMSGVFGAYTLVALGMLFEAGLRFESDRFVAKTLLVSGILLNFVCAGLIFYEFYWTSIDYRTYLMTKAFIQCNSVIENVPNATSSFLNYCSHPDCSLKNQHTMCVAAKKQSPRLYASGMTTWMRYQILLLHNRHRDNIAMGLEAGQPPATNMRKMYWDYELEQIAEVWARQCQKRHDECRNTIRFNVLQNMDVRFVVPRVTEAQLLADAVGAWFSGSRVLLPENVWSFRLSNCSSVGGCNAHWYSATAWASTWRLGCSQALCTVRKQSCSIYRKRRTVSFDPPNVFNNATTSSPKVNLLLRRPKTTATSLNYRETATITEKNINKESPLHRGIQDASNKKKKDLKIVAYTFCNYGPAGNIEGFPIYEAGTTCSNCPQGTQCGDRTHRALCSVVGDPDLMVPRR